MNYATRQTLDRPFDAVVRTVKDSLAEQGFGIISEIDMQETLRAKIGVDIDRHLILGACNPTYAYRALLAEPSISLLLPCNVVIRSTDQGTVVEMINPQILADLTDGPAMRQVAAEVSEKLDAAMESLRASA